MRKRGADTLLGNLWWVLDPLLQMVVYVVFVTIIARGTHRRTTRSSSSRRSCPGSGSRASVIDATGSVVSAGAAHQADPVPQDRAAGRGHDGRGRRLRLRADPARRLMLFYRDRISPFLMLHPAHRGGPVRVHARGRVPGRGRERLLPRPRQRHPARAAALVVYLSPGLYSLALLDDAQLVEQYPILKTLAEANPFAILFDAYRQRHLRHAETGRPGFPTGPRWRILLRRRASSSSALATVIFKRLEPNFAKVL